MTQSLLTIAVFIGLLACLPMAVKWLKHRSGQGPLTGADQVTVVSAVAVGPHQRVVTVEVGPQGARVRLTLGVTAQSVTCLHTAPAIAPAKLET
ncbi:MAG: flagellar biosynthetic protein FliO [Burkholderiales bacterium]|nr:flagellar biosynthetic protein FliO [Burkholderiales bacterium]